MREIKFRAWTKVEMIYEGWNDNFFVNKEIIFRYDNVMQYTGLKDKKGIEIYEGDVVNGCDFNGSYAHGKVVFWTGGWWVEPIPIIEGIADLYNQLPLIQVIGNIYEHPELIKEAEMSQQ